MLQCYASHVEWLRLTITAVVCVDRGTHGYMAPEVLAKGQAYDSSADWFSFGCMVYKLLRGHSPFRHHKTKDKHEIDRMTMTSVCGVVYCRFAYLV